MVYSKQIQKKNIKVELLKNLVSSSSSFLHSTFSYFSFYSFFIQSLSCLSLPFHLLMFLLFYFLHHISIFLSPLIAFLFSTLLSISSPVLFLLFLFIIIIFFFSFPPPPPPCSSSSYFASSSPPPPRPPFFFHYSFLFSDPKSFTVSNLHLLSS